MTSFSYGLVNLQRKPPFNTYPVEIRRSKLSAELNDITVQPELGRRCLDFALEYGIAPREVKTLVLIIQGWTYNQIANETHYHPLAIKLYIQAILKKAGCNNKTQLAFKVLWFSEE